MSRFSRWLAATDAFQQRHRLLAFPVAVVRKTVNDQGGSLAALIAYYGFLSMFPLLLVFAAGLGFVFQGDPSLKASVLRTTEQSFPVASSYIQPVVTGNGAALGIGIFGAIWAGLGVARATERAMNAVWDVPMSERPSLWRSRLRGLGMLGVLGLTFLVSTGLAGLQQVHGIFEVPARILGTLGPLALNFAMFALAFQVLTNRHVPWRSVLPGAGVGAVGWTALQSLGAYFARVEVAHASHLYGSLAAVIGLLAWIYLGAQLTIYSAQVNVVLAYRLWPRSLGRKVHTEGDRRSLVRQVAEAQRTVDEVITVHFPKSRTTGPGTDGAPDADGRPGGPALPAPPPEQLSSEALGTHTAAGTLIGRLQALDSLRQRLDASDEASMREDLAGLLEVESTDVAEAIDRLAAHEPALRRALARGEGRPG